MSIDPAYCSTSPDEQTDPIEAFAQLEIESKLALLQEHLLHVRRASPLEGMYTEEEEALLMSLEHRTVL